jgi:hypothetical protein
MGCGPPVCTNRPRVGRRPQCTRRRHGRGLIPSYTVLNGRRRARLSEVLTTISKTRKGAAPMSDKHATGRHDETAPEGKLAL